MNSTKFLNMMVKLNCNGSSNETFQIIPSDYNRITYAEYLGADKNEHNALDYVRRSVIVYGEDNIEMMNSHAWDIDPIEPTFTFNIEGTEVGIFMF